MRAASDRLRLRINFVVMRRNFRRLPEMVRLAGELGAEDLLPMPVDEQGERRHRLSARQILEHNREVAPEVLELRRRYGFSTAPALVYPFGVTGEEVRLTRAACTRGAPSSGGRAWRCGSTRSSRGTATRTSAA